MRARTIPNKLMITKKLLEVVCTRSMVFSTDDVLAYVLS